MINRVVLVGRLTRDPELKYTTNNIANLRFTVAVNRQFTSGNGERQADFINCVAWRNQAENMARFLKKGALIGVEGRIETGSYQAQDGQTRYTTDVVCDSVQFLEPRSSQSQNQQPYGGEQPAQNGFGGTNQYGGGNNNYGGFNNAPNNFQNNNSNNFGNHAAMDANPFPTNNQNSAPTFNSTIDISDDDLPF